MKVRVGSNICNVLGYDADEKVFEVKYQEEDEHYVEKYLSEGGSILWEEDPPQCSKCSKTNATCSNKCYNFKYYNNMKEIVQKHNALKSTRKEEIKAELNKIEEMKKEGVEYKSWLYKSLFESEDNTERMVFT